MIRSILGITALCVLVAPQTEPQTTTPEAVSAFAAQLETRLTETLDIVDVLSESRDEVVGVVRNYDRAAKAWQLDPSLAREASSEELFDFVATRASQTLICGADLLSRYSLEDADEETIERTDVRAKYWPAFRSVRINISPDCMTLTDSEGEPVRITTFSDLEDYSRLTDSFNSNLRRSLVEEEEFSKTETFARNMAYLEAEYNHGLAEVPGFAEAALLAPGARVFSTQVLNLTGYIQYLEGEAKLIFVAPFSS
jgi:hypothetical protein